MTWRNRPFVYTSPDRVGIRAYFHWKNGTGIQFQDPVSNWFQAEEEEAQWFAQHFLVEAREENGGQREELRFDDEYELIYFDRFPPRGRRFAGSNIEPRKCAMCLESAPRVTFRSDAHLIPELLGNHDILSWNECDVCNGEYGRKYEDELGKWFLPARAFGRLKSKGSGMAKLKRGKSGEVRSSVGGQGVGQPLQIHLVDGDPNVKIAPIDEHTFSISVRGMPFRPISAIKAIAKSAFLALDPERRSQYEFIRKWIRNEIDLPPVILDSFFVPGPGLPDTGLAVWELRELGKDLSPLVAMLWAGNFVLLWVPPGPDDLRYRPMLWPLLPRSPYPPHVPQHTRYRCLSDEKTLANEEKFQFHHAARFIDLQASSVDVIVRFEHDHQTYELRTSLKCDVDSAQPDERVYRLSGKDIAGELSVSVHPDENTKITFRPPTFSCNPELLLRTCQLVRSLSMGHRLMVLDPAVPEIDHRHFLITLPSVEHSPPSNGLEGPIQLASALCAISRILQVRIDYPQSPDEEEAYRAITLAHGLQHGQCRYRPPHDRLFIQASAEQRADLLKMVNESPEAFQFESSSPMSIFGVEIDPGARIIVVVEPRFVEPLEEDADGVELRCKGIIEQYSVP